MSNNVGYWGKICTARRSLAQFQSFLLVLLQLMAENGWRRDELSRFLSGCTLDSVRVSEWPAKKCVPSFLTQCHQGLGFQYNFRNENDVSVLIYQARNHLTVGTRVRRTSVNNIGFSIPRKPRIKTYTVIPRTISSSLTNHSFSLWKWYFGLDIPSKKSSRFRNACRAYDWWHHHLISSSRIRYPNNSQKKSARSPYQVGWHPNDQWKSVWWLPTAERRCGNSKYPAKKW